MSTENVIRSNISKTITRLKKDKITAMGLANIFQVTPTTGVTCHPGQYRDLFNKIAMEVAKERKFPILQCNHREQLKSGVWDEGAGGSLSCPYCGNQIGEFRQ